MYTPAMRRAIHEIKPPHGFIIEVVEYENYAPRFMSVRIYESQWNYFTEKERLDCVKYLAKIRKILTSNGNPVTLEPVIDTGETLPEHLKNAYRRMQ
jgi:hypothetical protein